MCCMLVFMFCCAYSIPEQALARPLLQPQAPVGELGAGNS